MSTIKDIAQYTGLSIATISKYINGGKLREDNHALIAEAIDALDYRVNLAARSLKTRKTMLVGVLLPNLTTPFFSVICDMIEKRLKKHGYSIVLCSYYEDPKEELEKLNFLLRTGVDGIILVPQYIDEADISPIKELMDRSVPLVLMDRHVPGLNFDRVLADNSSATYNAVEELIKNGHKRIGIIIGPPEILTAHERHLGYARVHEDYSIPLDPELTRVGDYSIGSGYSAMNELLNMCNPPTAVIGTNHDMTMGAITYAYEKKMRIPDDISFIGYDEIQLTKIINPPITIVLQPMEDIANITSDILIKRMRGDDCPFPQVHRLKTSLLLHESVKKLS